ncbi:hypothetical protein ACJJTC_006173 [Scirpophaga incertulas]
MREWGLEIYIPKFKEQAIDLETLQMLSENDVKELIPIIGHRAKLNSQIKMMKSITVLSQDAITLELLSNNQPAQPSDPFEQIQSLNQDCESTQQPEENLSEELDTTIFRDTNCELYKILISCNEGKSLLLKHKDGLLCNADRRRLCNIIISNELKNDPDKKISSTRLYAIAYQIQKFF